LAVVIASSGGRAWLSECLASLIPQCLRSNAELVVVRADTPNAIMELSTAYPYVRFIFAPPRTAVAELRSAGVAAVAAAVVALLDDSDDQAIPGEHWLERIRWRAERGTSATAHAVAKRSADPTALAAGPTQQPYLSVVVPAHQAAGILRHSLEAISRSDLPRASRELIVVDDASTDGTALVAAHFADTVIRLTGTPRGPAYARNRGFEFARGECVVFINADVCVHRDALSRFARILRSEPEVSAVFGSYDTHPAGGGFVSQYRSLLLHYYHQKGAGVTETFWAACGAVRSAAFADVGMFDEWRFPRRQIEDVELGYQLHRRGHQIVLRPEIQGTHCRRWTLLEKIATDLNDRAVPWMRVFSREVSAVRPRRTGRRTVKNINTALMWIALVTAMTALLADRPVMGIVAAACIAAVQLHDRHKLRFFARERGIWFALSVIPLQALSYLVNGVAVVLGWLLRELIGEPTPDPTVEAFAEVGVKMWPPVPVKRPRAGSATSE
jgi:glycosyltransferase involved in cell wall biosynthesis